MSKTKKNQGKNAPLRQASASDILGNTLKKVSVTQQEPETCFVCSKRITAERLAALKSLGIRSNSYTCVKHSTTEKIKGIYTGEVGTSKMLLVDKLYNDSVRSVFRRTETESSDSDSSSEPDVGED